MITIMAIANKYKLLEKINSGEFGSIFKGENIRTKELVAIKIEDISCNTKLLKRETQIYQYLGKAHGIPQVKWYGATEKFNYMVLPLYGESLLSKTFSLAETLSIGQQVIKILRYIHEKGLIHRDIKPDNFVFGGDDKQIYIIDFGLCRKYIDDNNNHIEVKSGKNIIGTPNFISVNVHNGIEPSRRDDMISVAYVLLYLINGSLPWQKNGDLVSIKLQKMCVCDWSKIPEQIFNYIKYCTNLKFNETPDYDCLINILNLI